MAGNIIRFDEGYRYDEGHHFDEPPAFFLPPPGTAQKGGRMPDFFPNDRDGQKAWYQNLKTEIVKPANDFGLTSAQKTAATGKCDDQLALYAATDAADAALKLARGNEKTNLPAGEQFMRTQINVWKVQTGFTPGIGAALKVIGTGSAHGGQPLKVKFTTEVQAGHGVYLKFVKGPFKAVHVYARLRGQSAWEQIGMDMSSPYLDSRPLAVAGVPEAREYMLRGVIGDEEVGVDSDIVGATYAG